MDIGKNENLEELILRNVFSDKANLEKWKLGKNANFENVNLGRWKFGNLEKCTFGKINIWKNTNLEKCKFEKLGKIIFGETGNW